jgi:hypothetical protein
MRKTRGRKSTGQRKRSQSDVGRAKNDLKRFAFSVAGLIPGIGTLLDIDNVYRDGKKLLSSGPSALKSMFSIRIGTKRRRRRSTKRSRR